MKIAAISDIHGNADALRAVLKQADALGAEAYVALGDYVGYYYKPEEVLEMLKGVDAKLIKGNHEALLEESMQDPRRAETLREKYGSGLLVAQRCLSEAQKSMLKSLPSSDRLEIGKTQISLHHGAPYDENAYLYADSPKESLDQCGSDDADIILFGHSHHQFIFRTGSSLVVNVGSVGQPRDVGGAATWVLIDTKSRTVIPQRTHYDVRELQREARQKDPHYPYLWEVLERNVP